MIGKQIRMERILNRDTGRTVLIPLDHGLSAGPIEGIIDLKTSIGKIAEGGANGIVFHKGNVPRGHRGQGKDIGLIVHLSASTSLSPDPNSKVLVCTVEEAIKIGADAVSIHVNLGAEDEKEMLKDFGKIAYKCMEWGMPLLAMVYTRGAKIKDEHDVKAVKHAARVAAELGADLVKVSFTGDAESFREVVEGCPIPVLIAGGEKAENDDEVFKNIRESILAGGKGVAIGRNVFQHKNPTLMTRAISALVHENKSLEEIKTILAGRS
ncbi:MAG: fructose-bisphosphate aldolase [Spirochaetes bacterium GWB1_36_13]|nr:MAG: fructose-bisphosphate aldolase [Spirochaetes bacterium GWB1_36_13]